MNKQLDQIPVISALEYDNCYFLIHRAYADNFGKMEDKIKVYFNKSDFYKNKNYINESKTLKDEEKIK